MNSSVQTRQRALLRWARLTPIFTISGWSRQSGVSYPTAKKDFDRVRDQFVPFVMGSQVMGFNLKEVF